MMLRLSRVGSGAVLCLLIFAGLGRAQSTVDQLITLRGIYQKGLTRIDAEMLSASVGVPGQYLNALKAMEKQKQAAGDLGGLLAVRKEGERFRANKRITDADILAEPADLGKLQISFKVKIAEAGSEAPRRTLALAQQYVARLKAMQTSLTKAGKIDDALAVNAEIKRVEGSREVSSATFTLAEHDAAKGKTDPASTDEPKERDAPSAVAKAQKQELPAVTKVLGATVYRKKSPPATKGVFLKRLAMRTTDASRLKRDVSVSVMHGGDWSSNHIRVTLRATGSGLILNNVRVRVQGFAKTSSSSSSKISPYSRLDRTIRLKQLASDYVHIAMDPFSNGYSSSSYSSSYKFYGVTVGVFDEKGNMLHQSSFPASLESYAKSVPTHSSSPHGGSISR